MIALSVPPGTGTATMIRKAMRTRKSAAHRGVLSLPLWITGCSAAPAQDLLGSFFPAWMLCAAIGVAAAAAIRIVLTAARIAESIPVPSLTYIVLAVAMTLLVWLLWFGH